MNKLHVKQATGWAMVFCAMPGKVITTCDKSKALPTRAVWAADDLKYFSNKYSNQQFSLRAPVRATS